MERWGKRKNKVRRRVWMESKRITEKQDAAYKDRRLKEQTRTNENKRERTNTQERFKEAWKPIIIILLSL